MKNIRFLSFIVVLGALFLSACGAATATPTSAPEAAASVKVEAMPVAFVGIVNSITGDQWVISGTTVTIDDSIVRDGPFQVGDQVKVEGHVNPDGSFSVSRVEAPRAQETATLPPFADDNSNDALLNGNTNDANMNDDQSTGLNSNDDNSNSANVNDDKSSDTNVNDDKGGSLSSNDNSSSANTNDDKGGTTNTNDNHGGSSSNDNGSGGSNSNGGDDKGGGNSNDG